MKLEVTGNAKSLDNIFSPIILKDQYEMRTLIFVLHTNCIIVNEN